MTFPEFIKQSLEREDSLFKLIYEFNVELGNYVDPSHIKDESLNKFFPLIRSSSKGRRRLSEYLLKQFGFQDKYCYHFEEPRMRLALVDENTLNKLLQFAGAALFAEHIQKVVMKQKLEAFRTDVGADLYYFISKRALLLKAFMPKLVVAEKELPAKEDIFEAGKLCFEYCFSNDPEELLKRLMLKFPVTVQWQFNRQEGEMYKTACWRYLERILTKEIEPKYSICFS